MDDRVRFILAVRAAGLVVVGLVLPEIVEVLLGVALDSDVLALRWGHEHAVIGFLSTIFVALLEQATLWSVWWVLVLACGLAMVAMRAERIMWILNRVEER